MTPRTRRRRRPAASVRAVPLWESAPPRGVRGNSVHIKCASALVQPWGADALLLIGRLPEGPFGHRVRRPSTPRRLPEAPLRPLTDAVLEKVPQLRYLMIDGVIPEEGIGARPPIRAGSLVDRVANNRLELPLDRSTPHQEVPIDSWRSLDPRPMRRPQPFRSLRRSACGVCHG